MLAHIRMDTSYTNYEELGARARELRETWINGNRSDALDALEDNPAGPALALLIAAGMSQSDSDDFTAAVIWRVVEEATP